MIPKTPVPQIATDATWTSGPETGQPTRFAVPLSAQKQGVLAGSMPAANMNGLLGPLSDHVSALSEISVRNWQHMPTATVSTAILPVDGIYVNGGIFVAPSASGSAALVFVHGTNSLGSAPVLARTRLAGIDWSTFSSMPGAVQVRAMAANSSYLVAVGSCGGNALYSTDTGSTWLGAASHNGNNYASVCELAGTFYAVNGSFAANGTVGKSVGNVAWTATAAATGAASLIAIRSGGTFLLCWGGAGAAGRTYVSGNAGATWTASIAPVFASLNAVQDIRYNAALGLWMAVSSKFEVATSPDGVTWNLIKAAQFSSNITPTLATDGSGVWVVAYSLCDANNLPGACVAYSLDGIVWKNYSLRDVACSATSCCYSALHDCFFVMLHDGVKAPQIFRSLSTGTGAAFVG